MFDIFLDYNYLLKRQYEEVFISAVSGDNTAHIYDCTGLGEDL